MNTTDLVQPSKRINLSRLTEDQLIAELDNINEQATMQIERIEMQAALWRWRILWELRKRFKSDRLFGQYLNDLREKRGIYIGTGSVVNREIHAGRFCEMYKIESLEKVGVGKSTIYALSRPANKEIAGDILRFIAKKNIPYVEVEKIIAEKRTLSINTDDAIDSTAEISIDAPAAEKRFYLVQNNQIANMEVSHDLLEVEEVVAEVEPTLVNDGFQSLMQASLVRHDTVLTEDQMLSGVLDLLDSYGISYMQKLVLIKHVQTALQNKMYPSK